MNFCYECGSENISKEKVKEGKKEVEYHVCKSCGFKVSVK